MKIDIGESLVNSYLRHVMGCCIVQSNWKPSDNWPVGEMDLALARREFERIQRHKAFTEIFKTGFEQTVRQTEVDVLGYTHDKTIYAANVTFHKYGINFGSRTDTRNRVIKSLLRAYLALICYFPGYKHVLLYCSPKVTGITEEVLQDYFRILKQDFSSEEVEFKYLSNDSFRDQVLMHTLDSAQEHFDTSELFLRSFKLLTVYAGDEAEEEGEGAEPPAEPQERKSVRTRRTSGEERGGGAPVAEDPRSDPGRQSGPAASPPVYSQAVDPVAGEGSAAATGYPAPESMPEPERKEAEQILPGSETPGESAATPPARTRKRERIKSATPVRPAVSFVREEIPVQEEPATVEESPEETPRVNDEAPTVQEEDAETLIEQEIAKVKSRVPKWFQRSSQNNSKILIRFMELYEKDENVSLRQLSEMCGDVKNFAVNFAQMNKVNGRNHGKVFTVKGETVVLWEPVRDYIIQEYIAFKKSYYSEE